MFPINEYIDMILGDYAQELESQFFTDNGCISYLDAIKFNAELIFNGYSKKQGTYLRDDDADEGLINSDVLHTVLLSLHPINEV